MDRQSINTTALIMVAPFVVAPVFNAATVRIVAAAPGSVPVNEHNIFPIPCGMSNFAGFDGCFVIELHTSPVKRVSDDKIIASIIE